MKNVSYKRSQADKLILKGVVTTGENGEIGITYNDDDGVPVFCDIAQCVSRLFFGQEVSFTMGTKTDEDCTNSFINDLEDDEEE